MKAGVTYRLTATGQWKDASIPCGPDGYDSVNFFQRLTEKLRRAPAERWFTLIGALDARSDTQFAIRNGRPYTATADGELTCFANDLTGFYWNNHGAITLTIEAEAGV